MADRSIKINLDANVTGLVSGFKTAGVAAKNLNSRIMQNEQAARDLTTGLGLIGAAGVAGAGIAIKTFASFDKTMSNVKATGEATATQLAALREAAIKAGADTAFSASEAAAGVENLLKAGVSARDVLGGGLTGALDLAAAGELDVASAAEIASTAMTQFGLAGGDVTHIADLLAAGAGKAQGDVTDLAAALKQGGLVASQTGLTIEETTGTLSAFAAAGLLGSDAGTSFKTMLQRLSAPTGKAASLMDELGINAYDASGQFVGMSTFAGQLTDALGDMTPAQRNAALATIFGADAVRAASVIYEQGEGGIRKWIGAVDDQGYAAQVAATRLDNLQGDLEAFRGSLETALIKSGSAGNDALRGLVQGATDAVNAFSSLNPSVLKGLTLVVGGGGLLALGAAGFGKLVIGINNAKSAMATLGISAKTATLSVAGVGAALGVATLGLVAWSDNAAEAAARTDALKSTLDEYGRTTDETIRSLNETLSSPNQVNLWEKIMGAPKENDTRSAFELAEKLKIANEDVTLAILGNADAQERVNAAIAAGQDVSVFDTDTRRAAATLAKIIGEQQGALKESTTEKERAAAANKLLEGSDEKAATAAQLDAAAQQEAAQASAERASAIEDLVTAMHAQREAQDALSGEALSSRQAQRALEESIDAANKALKDNGATLDLNTEKGRANQDALDGIASAGRAYVDALRDQGASQGKINGALERSRRQFLDVADSMGLSEKKAKELARELGLMPDAEIKVDADTTPARREGESTRDYLNRLRAEFAVRADGTLAREEGESTGDYIDRLKATIMVDGGTVPARREGESAQQYIDRLKSTIGVDSNTSLARREGESARDYIKRLKGAIITVDADTSDAKEKVSALREQVLRLPDKTITVTTDTRVTGPGMTGGGLPWGDGEGAGWSGGTPRGVSQMSRAVRAMDSGARITSGYRPGAITATGYPSYHGMGRAIDIVSPNMGRTFDMLARAFGSRAKELYYTPRGFIRNGRWTNDVAAVTRRDHYSHVHLALNRGGGVRGPGTGTSDDIPAWLSNGEHVLTASDVRKLGGQEAVYRLRAAVQAGEFNLDPEATFATGGAVRSAERSLSRARRELEQARKARRDAKKDRARNAAQKRVDKAEERVANARERLSNLRVERRDLGVDLRRRAIRESATGGLSGAYSVADEMLGLARSGDLTRGQSRTLASRARRAESAMRGLYRQSERLEDTLGKAREHLEGLASTKASVGSALAGEYSIGANLQKGEFRDVVRTNSRGETYSQSVYDPGPGVTGKGLVTSATATASRMRTFAHKLKALRKKGLSGAVLEEVAGLGSEQGIQVANALLDQPGQIDDLNRAYRGIKNYSNAAGGQVAEGFGLSAAKGLVKGLERRDAKVERQIEKWGVYMANGLISALGGRKKIRARANGGPISAGTGYLVGEEGPEFIVPRSSGYVLTAEQTRRLAATAMTKGSAASQQSSAAVQVHVDRIVAVDENAAVNRLVTKMTDAVNAYGVGALAQGVGV